MVLQPAQSIYNKKKMDMGPLYIVNFSFAMRESKLYIRYKKVLNRMVFQLFFLHVFCLFSFIKLSVKQIEFIPKQT